MKYFEDLTWKDYLFYLLLFVLIVIPQVLNLQRAMQRQEDLEELLALFIILDLEHQAHEECMEETFPDD